MQYTIKSFVDGTLEVECEGRRFGVTLPLTDRQFPTGHGLHVVILQAIPLREIDRDQANPTNIPDIEALVGQTFEFEREEAEAAQITDLDPPAIVEVLG